MKTANLIFSKGSSDPYSDYVLNKMFSILAEKYYEETEIGISKGGDEKLDALRYFCIEASVESLDFNGEEMFSIRVDSPYVDKYTNENISSEYYKIDGFNGVSFAVDKPLLRYCEKDLVKILFKSEETARENSFLAGLIMFYDVYDSETLLIKNPGYKEANALTEAMLKSLNKDKESSKLTVDSLNKLNTK